jgi:hypothetical protein
MSVSPRVLLRICLALASVAALSLACTETVHADGPSGAGWSNVPPEITSELGIFAPKGISAFAIAPNLGFALVTNDRRLVTRNTPPLLADKLRESVENGQNVLSIAFTPEGGWAFVTDQGATWDGINIGCVQAIQAAAQRNEKVLCVTFGINGAWIVVTDREFFTGNLPPDFVERLRSFAMNGGVKFAALSPAGGASVFANGTRYQVQGVPIDCEQFIERASVDNQSIDDVAFTSNGGWVVVTSRAN